MRMLEIGLLVTLLLVGTEALGEEKMPARNGVPAVIEKSISFIPQNQRPNLSQIRLVNNPTEIREVVLERLQTQYPRKTLRELDSASFPVDANSGLDLSSSTTLDSLVKQLNSHIIFSFGYQSFIYVNTGHGDYKVTSYTFSKGQLQLARLICCDDG